MAEFEAEICRNRMDMIRNTAAWAPSSLDQASFNAYHRIKRLDFRQSRHTCAAFHRLVKYLSKVEIGRPMYTLIQQLGIQVALKKEFAPLFVSFLIAEFFYKFHSFALECGAFLVTWAVFSFLQDVIIRRALPSSS